ncbi:SgcJ/EcaC family oxidoreductase (plasmid) [Cupriavidus necator]|uniref:SgcJ/EcaC family oxidoreductase n=1 Tax=Cupriavidus necator TaxID=106590 RepID=A0A367PMX3_CUPNE|nr:SgcJ/EcaC family oxidoreductase [Cupriavidus necator]QQX89770.1 SgcJ/EcaC family oxidoreductase [Cupriavidus necator]RCJ08355.1 SgcJ/EcaC family oxidoreductase [Cupriavidus necator]
MSARSASLSIVFVLSTVLSACATTTTDDNVAKEQVAAATRAWIDAISSHNQEHVLALYDPEAVLWGTTSPTIRDNPESVREYFNFLRTAPPYYKGILGEQRIRVHDDMAINTGTYTFVGPAVDAAGKPVSRPARFSFVYRYRNGRWLIVDHHSSAVPAPASPTK